MSSRAATSSTRGSLTDEMRRSSKSAHDRSHSIVLGKMVMVLTSRALYGKALACFYVVFDELERQLKAIAHTNEFWREVWATLEPVNRTAAFEADLQFYLPGSWPQVVREVQDSSPHIQNYVSRLKTIGASQADHYLFMAYVFHLYLGLLAGGSILKTMVQATLRLQSGEGVAIFEMHGENKEVRNAIKRLVNSQVLDDNQRSELMRESSRVFELNNDVIANFSTEGYMSHDTKFALLLAAFLVVLVIATVLTSKLLL